MSIDFTDAWVLQSIYNTEKDGQGADLADMIAFADYSNHAIMTYAEFSRALTTLISIGLVSQHNNRLTTAKEFKDWWNKIFGKKKNVYVHKELDEITKYLTKVFEEFDSGKKKSSIEITENDFNKAVKEYLERST